MEILNQNRNWNNRNIINMIDLFNTNGNLSSIEELKNQYGIRGTFLDIQNVFTN